jgi:hypothetical protein
VFETFLILGIIKRDVVMHVTTSSREVPVVLVGISGQIFEKSLDIKFHENHPVKE